MRRDARNRTAWAGAAVVACASALSIVSDGQATPLRQLDPKTGLPQTWNSQVGVSPPPVPGSSQAHPPHMVRKVLDPCKQFDRATACADPAFLTRCPKDATACSAGAALDACKGQSGSAASACTQAFFQKQQAQVTVTPVRRVVPSRRSLATASSSTTYVPYDRSKVTVSGMDHSFSARLASAGPGGNAPVPSGGHAPHVTDMQAALKKLPNAANSLIQSCDEYGARKYMSLTLFDEDVNSLQRDPRKVYDLIFGSSKWASIVQKSQVLDSENQVSTKAPRAYMDEAGNIVTPKPGDLKFKSVPGPRNQFLQLASTFSVPTALPVPDFSAYPPIAAVMAQYQKNSGVFLNQQLFTQHHFTAADSPTVWESFDWHRQENGALREQDTQNLQGKFTDEELSIRYAKQKGLRNLLAQRNELTHFMGNVGSICRKKAKPAPIPSPDVNALQSIANSLMKYTAQDPEALAGTNQYMTTVDPLFMQVGLSKGWSVYAPYGAYGGPTGTLFTAWGPAANNMLPWGMQYQPGNSEGVWVYTGDWRLGAAGLGSAPAAPNPVTATEVQVKATDYSVQLMFAQAKKAAIPEMEAEQYDAYLQTVAADNAECEKYGISQMFESDGVPYGSSSGTFSLSATPSAPPMTRSEQTVIANSFATKVLPQLAAIDALIAEQVDSGIELGCFDTSPNGCDWSPDRLIDFVHSYRKEMDQNREADVQRCMLYTTHNPNFSYKAKLNDLMKSKGYDWNKGSRDTVKHFEAFMRDGEAEMIKQLKDEVAAMTAMQVYDEDGQTPAIGQVTNTDGGFGGDMFGATYGAGGGYRFGSLSTDPQRAVSNSAKDDFSSSSTANADHFTYWAGNFANASINILGATLEVFNARMDIALTDGHVMDLQLGAGKNNTDGQYLSDYIAGINSAYNSERDSLKAKGKTTDRIAQGHMHFRVVGDDVFGPVDKAVNATVYASNERLYSFEPASYDNTFFDESTTFVIVFVPVTLRGWATFHAGIDYTINASVDRPNVDASMIVKKTDPTPFQLANTIEPYAEIDGNLSVAIGVPGLEVGVKGSLQLIELGLPYTSSAAVQFFNGGSTVANQSAGNRFTAKQGLDLTLQTLSGSVSGFVEFLLWTDEAEIFGWNGLTSTTPIFSVNEVNASVSMSAPAVRVLKPGFVPGL